MTVLLTELHSNLAKGQTTPTTTLTIDIADAVEYQADIGDPLKFATDPNKSVVLPFKNFTVSTLLGDIAAVNGQPFKGIFAARTRGINTSSTPITGQAIADVTRTGIREILLEILNPDGTPIGTIMALGFSGGTATRGLHSANIGNWASGGGLGGFP